MMKFTDLVRIIKSEYGVNQTALARHIGVSPQILTDIKTGRRRFTPAMAESIMALFADEPSAGRLAESLQAIIAEGTGGGANGNSDAAVSFANAHLRVPVMNALCKGDPYAAIGNTGKTALIPEAVAPFVGEGSFSYVHTLDCDDYSGRLRAGDQILIVQNLDIPREIMVIESRGRLRLARNAAYRNGLGDSQDEDKGPVEQWLALDTGKPLHSVSFAGAVVGIVVAVL